jgi:hypothetical protein
MLHLSWDAHFGADSSSQVRRHASLVWWNAPSLWSIMRSESNKRPIPLWSVLRRNVSLAHGPLPDCSSPLGTYSSAAGHRIPPHNRTSPLYFPLSTYILVDYPPPKYAQRLDWGRGHDMPRLRHPTLTCSTVDTNRPSCYIRVRACAAPTCISRQTWGGACSGAAPAALCCETPCSHAPSLLCPSLCCTHSSRPVSPHTHTHSKKSTSKVRVKQEYKWIYVSKGGLQQLHISRVVNQ